MRRVLQPISHVGLKGFPNHQTLKSTILGVVVAVIVYRLFKAAHSLKKGKLPPGPKGAPFFGNLFQLSKDAWVTFAEWGQQYGTKGFCMTVVLSDSECHRSDNLSEYCRS